MKPRGLPVTLPLTTVLLLGLSASALGQQSSAGPATLADAARAAQAQKANSATPSKVVTNDDLAPQSAPAVPVAAPPNQANSIAAPQTQSNGAAATQTPPAVVETPSGDCHNPEGGEVIQAELQAAQDELDQLRRDLAENPMAIPDQNIDMTNFKPSGSGVEMGSAPMSQAQPQSPGRIKEVELQQRIASLKRAGVITCDSPENGAIQRKIDEAQKQLRLAQRELSLDSSTYYSKPDYSEDTAGKSKIDAEQEQVESLQAEIDSLEQELAAAKSN